MADNTAVAQEIQTVMGELASLDVEEQLVRSKELGTELDFSKFRANFEDAQQFSREIGEMNLGLLPRSILGEVLASANSLRSSLNDIPTFSPSSGPDYRDTLGRSFMSRYEDFRRLVLPFTGYLAWNSSQRERARLESLVSEFQSVSERTLTEYETQTAAALATIRKAAAEQGVSQEAATFRDAADRYATYARRWLKGAISAAIFTVAAAVVLVRVWLPEGNIGDADVLQIILAKAAALGVATYLTVTAVRLYRTNTHLAAVNRHREDALRTFQTFVEGTESSEIKDKILLAAAHAAFGHMPTGLVSDTGDGGNMVEVLDGIGGSLIRRS